MGIGLKLQQVIITAINDLTTNRFIAEGTFMEHIFKLSPVTIL